MQKIAIITDSNSGISQAQGKALGIHVVPMPFIIDGKTYFEDTTLQASQFYACMAADAEISTSQPAPQDILALWNNLLKTHDAIVHIPMSSGLSGSCSTAHALSADFDGRVQVVDNLRISVTQRQSALDALTLARRGLYASEIKTILEETRYHASIYIMVDTLKYLRKGGRLTPAAAAIGTLLKIKPVLQIQGDKLDAFSLARNLKNAKNIMMDAVDKDIRERFPQEMAQGRLALAVVHCENESAALSFKEEVCQHYPGLSIHLDHLSLSIGTHIGPGALALALYEVLE